MIYILTEDDLKELCNSLREKLENKACKTGDRSYSRAGDMAAQIVKHRVTKVQTKNQPKGTI